MGQQEGKQSPPPPKTNIAPLPGNTKELAESLEGQLQLPDTAEYDKNRSCWNHDAAGWPSAIASVVSEKDVVNVVNYARENGCSLCVAGGRHSHFCMLNNALVLDFSRMKKIEVNTEEMTVSAQPGVKLGELDATGAKHGVVVPAGHNPDTGIAGLTLGGGVGYLVRKHGLTIDNLIGVRMVLANGELVTANETENPDLFWGVRGGSGNFGVITEFTYRCHPIPPQVLGGSKVYVLNTLPLLKEVMASKFEILQKMRNYAENSPREVGSLFAMPTGGPLITIWVHCGTPEEGKKEFDKMDMPFTPIDDIKPVSYQLEMQRFAEGPNRDQQQPGFYFEKGLLFENMSDDCLREWEKLSLETLGEGVEGVLVGVLLGGAMADVPTDATAFEHRNAKWWGLFLGHWQTPEQKETAVAWARRAHATLKPYSIGTYAPVIGLDEEEADPSGLVYQSNHPRLKELKNLYDPHNLFRNNRNINPQ